MPLDSQGGGHRGLEEEAEGSQVPSPGQGTVGSLGPGWLCWAQRLPSPSSAGKGSLLCSGLSPMLKASALPCPVALPFSPLKVPGGQGSELTLLCPRPRLPGWAQPSILPPWLQAELQRNYFSLGKSLCPPPRPPPALLQEVLAGQPGQLYSPWREENINPVGARGRR